jgi:uncharacterized protein YhbP (UPF0306 family)
MKKLMFLALIPATIAAQRPNFGSTLFWESGLINAPAAYVSPVSGDMTMNFARLGLDSAALPSRLAKGASYNISFSGSAFGRAELGVSVFSGDLKFGGFAKVMVWDQVDGMWRQGLMRWLPSVAVGIRNVGTQKSLNRLAMTGSTTNLNTAMTLYGVATRTFIMAAGENNMRPRSQVSVTGGWGNGLFSDDGQLGTDYAKGSTGGVFGGVTFDMATGPYSTLALIAEHDAWGVNAGARFDWRGIRFALFGTELGGESPTTGTSGNYTGTKIAASIGFQTNFFALQRGNRLEARTQKLEEQQSDLARQVRLSQQLIDVIEGQIDALNAITTQERNAERAELQRRLRDEQEALRRLQEQIKAREAAKKPPLNDR